jgi:glycosyltransferase involved in cell wall biosynthesis
MCGGGPEEVSLWRLIRERGMERTVRMAGEVEPERMNKWMQASDMFVLASHTEGMPNVVMEAMACGLPVVATAVGGLPGAIGDCDGAILVPSKNIDELEKALIKVISNKQLREQMRIAARKRAEEKFGGKPNARLILDYLQKIAEQK